MLSIAPQIPNFAWLLNDPFTNEQSQNNYYFFSGEKTPTSEDSIELPSPSSQAKNGDFASFCDELNSQGDTGNKTVKKINHNASERDRRKKINNLYTTLRSLLPPEDQSKKLSIPNTISRVLKYIPELQTEVERLVHKKESFKSKILKSHDDDFKSQKKTKTSQFSASAISATQISNAEMIIQISVPKVAKCSVSEALLILEQEGFLVLSSSCSESSHGRVFCNFHLQGQLGQVLDAEILKEKLWSIYENEVVLTSSFGLHCDTNLYGKM